MTACPSGKHRYGTARAAQIALTTVRARAALRIGRRWQNRRESRTYPCRRCAGWHLTSQPVRTNPRSNP